MCRAKEEMQQWTLHAKSAVLKICSFNNGDHYKFKSAVFTLKTIWCLQVEEVVKNCVQDNAHNHWKSSNDFENMIQISLDKF